MNLLFTATSLFLSVSALAEEAKPYILRYDSPAEDSNSGWANRSIPLGNGYMGANVFGRTDSERIQITENSLYEGPPTGGFARKGLNNFAEVYIDFNHKVVSNYEQTLDLNESISTVKYESGGVTYQRDYFTSYPDKVMVIKLSASEAGALSFTLRPTIPHKGEGKVGSVKSEGDTVTLGGQMTHYKIDYEGQFKVIPTGGEMKAKGGTIAVKDADSAIIITAVGTNYKLDKKVYLEKDAAKKLAGYPHPHEKVSRYIAKAAAKSYEDLLATHQADYKEFYDRVSFDLGAKVPKVTTDKLVDDYPKGPDNLYFEELAFHYGRYLLICSSRKGTLPPHLQGIWNVYAKPPWASQYLHDTNVQMAYAPVFSANMPELFESYADFFLAFMPRQAEYADEYIKKYNPSKLGPKGENGWSGPFWADPYNITGKSVVAGFGTGSWIGQMFWDYYDYTRDEETLEKTVYPVMYEQANFVSRFVQDFDGALLAKPSSSPEQKRRNVVGTTFDQQMFYENHHNTLKAAEILGRKDEHLELYKKQLPLLDPILVGKSGQIKEFRDENFYGEHGDPHHRHTSMLLGQYPGQLINNTTPAWLDAVEVSLVERTNKSHIGWARAERVAFWARVYDGDEAYTFYQDLLEGNYMHNLFNDHRGEQLFQADANYGATAGVAEMLMQSQDYVITLLPAIPKEWPSGSYEGLLARGNFEVSAVWKDGQATKVEILSKSGGELRLRYPNIAKATISQSGGDEVEAVSTSTDYVVINSEKGKKYTFTKIPPFTPLERPQDLKIAKGKSIGLTWKSKEKTFNIYRAVGSAPDYELVEAGVEGNSYSYIPKDLGDIEQMTLKVTAVKGATESQKGATAVWFKE